MKYITRGIRFSSQSQFLNRTTLFIFSSKSTSLVGRGTFTFRVTQHIPCLLLRSFSCWCNFDSFFSTSRSRSRTSIFFISSFLILLGSFFLVGSLGSLVSMTVRHKNKEKFYSQILAEKTFQHIPNVHIKRSRKNSQETNN